jgi:glycosyltransferase involved in cell wall biosynthesis
MARFSIIITSYNQRSFIRQAVESALGQEYVDKEVIVVDDGSTDGSQAILSEFGNRIKPCFLETNQGAGAARNHGVFLASGDYIIFLDGDDMLLPWALEAYCKIVDIKRPVLILARLLHFEGKLSEEKSLSRPRKLEVVEYETLMKKDRYVRFSSTAVIDRESFNHCGGWAADMFPLDDHDLLLRLGYAGLTIHILAPATVAYRRHGDNITRRLDRMADGALKLMQNERAHVYPGGIQCRRERYAVIGGFAFYWLQCAFRAGFYSKASQLLVSGFPFILTALVRKSLDQFRNKLPIQIIPLTEPATTLHHSVTR